MRKVIAIFLTSLLFGAPEVVLAAKVIAVPAAVAKKWEIDTKWYKQYTTVRGIPIVASNRVDSRALIKAAAVTRKMLLGKGYGPKIAKHLRTQRAKIGIYGANETIRSLPEARRLGKSYDRFSGLACCDRWIWDKTSRSWIYSYTIGIAPAMNVLQVGWPGDKSAGISILQHEFAHVIHRSVLWQNYKGIYAQIKKAYSAAKKKHKWKGAYAGKNFHEYWAEGSAIWFAVHHRDVSSKKYWTTGGSFPKNRDQLKRYDPALFRILLKVYGGGRWRFDYGPIYSRTAYKLSTPFGSTLAKAAGQNYFMVGEDFDLKIIPTAAAFSFQDYRYIGVDDPAKNTFKLGVKQNPEGDTPNMGGNFALTHEGEEFTYKAAADETFLGSRGAGWLSYDNAQSLYLNVGRKLDLGGNWVAQGDLTYGFARAKAKKDSVFQDYSTVHAIGFDASATYSWTDKDSIQFSASSPLRVEEGSLVIESTYSRERIQLSPNARQIDLGVAYTRTFETAVLTTTIQFTENIGHYQGRNTAGVVTEYSLSF